MKQLSISIFLILNSLTTLADSELLAEKDIPQCGDNAKMEFRMSGEQRHIKLVNIEKTDECAEIQFRTSQLPKDTILGTYKIPTETSSFTFSKKMMEAFKFKYEVSFKFYNTEMTRDEDKEDHYYDSNASIYILKDKDCNDENPNTVISEIVYNSEEAEAMFHH